MEDKLGNFRRVFTFGQTEPGRRTLGYYLLFICLGLTTAVIGPTLPALADQTRTPLGEMGWMFLVGAAGYTAGTLLGGRIFDRLRGHPLLGFSQLASAVLFALFPLMPQLGALLFVVVCKGVADGMINTGANTLLVWTHKEKVGPFMNGLHFCFGLGAFLAPFLVAQVADTPGGYRGVYWLLAAFAILGGLNALTLPGQPRPAPHAAPATEASPAPDNRRDYPVALMAALFLFFYVGAELAFGGWIYTYAVTLNLMGAAEAAYLTSAFWLSFTIGRLLSIPLATRLQPRPILLAALFSCLAIMGLLFLAPGSGLALWLVAISLGFCMAPVWPTGFTLAGQSLRLTARMSGFILLGDSFGGMVLPWLVGQVIGRIGPRALVYLVFASLIGNVLALWGLLRRRPVTDMPASEPTAQALPEG